MSQGTEPPRTGNAAPPLDPWEARERERARYAAASSSSRPRGTRAGGDEPLSFNVASYLAAGLIAAIAALLLGETYHVPAELRSILTVGGSVLVLLLFASVRSYADDLRVALRRGPNPFLLGMVLWAGIAYFLSPYRAITSFGASELLRVLTGVGVYFLAAYGLRSPRELANATVGAIGLAVLMALSDFWLAGQSGGVLGAQVRDRNLFGTHENLGALLLLVLPLSVSFSLSAETEEKRRVAAQAATLVLGAALLLTRARSAWFGTAFALMLLALLTAWTRPRAAAASQTPAAAGRPVRRGHLRALADLFTSPTGLLVLGLVAVIIFGGAAAVLQRRASVRNVLADTNLDGRVSVWKAASRMTYERPWTGWGLGSYWLIQGRWTHVGADVVEVLSGGAYQDNNAHDYYVQWAADTGAPGLFLYGGAVAALLIAGGAAVVDLHRRREEKPAAGRPVIPPFQRALLLGCIASVAGASLDAIASPAYVFHGISALFWLVAGLGVAAMRPVVTAAPRPVAEDAPAPIPALPPTRPALLAAALLPPLAVVGLILYTGHRQIALGARVLRGALGVSADAVGPVMPGQRVTWRALYRDADGQYQSTCPGVIWEFSADRKTVESFRLLRLDTSDKTTLAHGGLSVAPSGAEPTVAVHAIYNDAYGRRYDAWSVIKVAQRGKASPPHRSAASAAHHR